MLETPAQFLTRPEVADLLRVSLSTVDRWRLEGRLRAVKVSGAVRFNRADVEALMGTQEP